MRARSIASVLAVLVACDERPTPSRNAPPTANPASVAETMGMDASALGEGADPPAPAGDLKAELERFTDVAACVRDKKNIDPLVGDALHAIGYETFIRDACRLLEAARDRRKDACEKIDSSALRSRCQSWVAIVVGSADACPLQFDGLPARGRIPTCVAVASKDPRLCASEARATARASCEALVTRDEKRCDVLLPNDRPICAREALRWKSLLASPLDNLPKLMVPKARLVVRGSDGTADPQVPESDMGPDFARGAVVVTVRDRLRVELGTTNEEAVRIAASPNRRPRLGLALVIEPPALGATTPRPVLERVEIEVPGEAAIVYPGARADWHLARSRVDRVRGGELDVAFDGVISANGRSYKVEVAVTTFVRDVVAELPGSRAIAPTHPFVAGGGAPLGGARPYPKVDGGLFDPLNGRN